MRPLRLPVRCAGVITGGGSGAGDDHPEHGRRRSALTADLTPGSANCQVQGSAQCCGPGRTEPSQEHLRRKSWFKLMSPLVDEFGMSSSPRFSSRRVRLEPTPFSSSQSRILVASRLTADCPGSDGRLPESGI
jgi:hypothetical protein